MRSLLFLLLPFLLTGCISGISYGDVPHAELARGPSCPKDMSDGAAINGQPYFLVTSRLPDCRAEAASLTSFRGFALSYGRFAEPVRQAKGRVDREAMVDLSLQPRDTWLEQLENAAQRSDGHVLVYVHGFRETLGTSAADTAQIARLAEFEGPVIHYSWPSQGELLSYAVDETNMYWDERNFRGFLQELTGKSWVRRITIVAHSLGVRLVPPSIEYVDGMTPDRAASKIANIILASPDTDRREFERDVGAELLSARRVAAGRRMLLYVSNRDRALDVSRTLHGYPRLGRPTCFDPFRAAELEEQGLPARCYPGDFAHAAMMGIAGLTVIDTTDVGSGNSGHSDYLRSAAACRDFAAALQGRTPENGRRLPTHLPYVFRLPAYREDEKPDHVAACRRTG